MGKLNEILHELGISKVKLAKFLGVSRQMIYNYLELDDINKWPKDKKVLLLNLLGVKSAEEINNIFQNNIHTNVCDNNLYNSLGKKEKELLASLIDLIKDGLEDSNNSDAYYEYKYLYNFLQAMNGSREPKFILGYIAKAAGFVDPMEFVFDEEQQFIFESIMFSAMTLYASGAASKTKLAESHKRFEEKISNKKEELMSRTMELNTIKLQALKELGYTEINESNASEIFERIAEIQSRKISG